MSEYAGESLEKKVARAAVYRFFSQFMPKDGSAKVVGLAGPTANDVDLCTAFGIARPENISLADVDDASTQAASKKGARGFHGPIQKMPHDGPVDLAVFDWCGQAFSAETAKAYLAFRYRIGSFIVVTYARGRETETSSVKLMRRNLQGRLKRDPSLDEWRDYTVVGGISAVLNMPMVYGARLGPNGLIAKESTPLLVSCGVIQYQGHSVPMSIAIMRVLRKSQFLQILRSDAPYYAPPLKISKGVTTAEVLSVADALEAEGTDPAKALAVSPGTLAAWRAHRTMGTYDKVG